MSTYVTPETQGPETQGYWDEERSSGWVAFAGSLLLLVGTMNCIEGIAAIGNAHFFVHNTNYVFGSLNTWGWIALCVGVLQLAVGVGVFVQNQFARWTGVVVLSINAIVQMLMIPAYPFWSLSFFAIDILAIFGLVVHGKRLER